MPDPEVSALEQDACLWPFVSCDAHGGPVVDTMVELNAQDRQGVRWKWTRSEMLDPQRNTVSVDATVIVNRDVPIDSLMWLGSAADLAGTAGPQDQWPSGLCQVKTSMWTLDVKGRVARRTLGVVRFRGNLPSGVG